MGSSAILRRSRSAVIFRSLCDYNSTATFRSLNSWCGRESAVNRVMSTMSGVSSSESRSPSISPPWLMLPPSLEGGDKIYKFFRPTESGVMSFTERSHGGESPDDDARLVGCSHGWVALFNRRNNDLFISNPITRRHIKLPPIHTLPDPELNLDLDGHGSVSKVILSSSPDDEECRGMMSFGPSNRLAFCLPGRSSGWTPIGHLFEDSDHHYPFIRCARVYEDLVYCSRRKVFTSITSGDLNLSSLYFLDRERYFPERHDWDIEDPACAGIVRSEQLEFHENGKGTLTWLEENIEVLEDECIQIPHLVYAEHSDQLFLALRFVQLMNPDGHSPLGYIPYCGFKGLSDVFPGKTFGFIVIEIDEEGKCTVVDDLNGLAMFVGVNNSFAIPAFKPNSIYFTDANRIRMISGANDTGIFDYQLKTISPCYHAPTTSTPHASPVWFTSNCFT
ncbi:hypothetical protein C2S51_025131 [Perilla frutescens var. frutescens]|nr:hypothetical protein C2S51_025131 [Perilla frutescens var. frutescens]